MNTAVPHATLERLRSLSADRRLTEAEVTEGRSAIAALRKLRRGISKLRTIRGRERQGLRLVVENDT